MTDAAAPEMTVDDLAAHVSAIARAASKESFVLAFEAYVQDVVQKETDPYEKIALFVHGLLESHGKIIDALVHHRAGKA